jgi:hypothetical protein
MQKFLIGVLAVTTVALGILCAAQWRQLRANRSGTQAAEVERASEIAAARSHSERVAELERANERLEQQVQKFASVTTQLRTNEARQATDLATLSERMRAAQRAGGSGAASEGDGNLGKGMGEMLGNMMKDPAMREMLREQQKVAINMMYAGLFKDLKLSPEEKDRLKDILTEAQMKNMENAQGILGGNKEGAGDGTQKRFEDGKKEVDAQIKALLGDERYAYYEDYQKNLGERMQVDQLKTQLAGQNLPLQDQQSAQLLQIMKDEKAAVPPIIPTDNTQFPSKDVFTAENLEKQIKWMEDYNRRVLDRAGQVLTPEQLISYRAFQEQQSSMQKLGLKMAGQMFGGDRPAPPPR